MFKYQRFRRKILFAGDYANSWKSLASLDGSLHVFLSIYWANAIQDCLNECHGFVPNTHPGKMKGSITFHNT